MKQEWKITKKIHYSDPVNEDFNDVGLKRPAIPSGYKYSKFGFSRFIGNCLYYLLAKPILSIGCFFNGVRIKNRKQLKILRICSQTNYLRRALNGGPNTISMRICVRTWTRQDLCRFWSI